ncbi:hypothetical protein ACFWNK_10235 [Streptomyces sp. NPDC058417]
MTSRVTEDMENFTTAVPLLAEVVTAGGTVAVSLAAFFPSTGGSPWPS